MTQYADLSYLLRINSNPEIEDLVQLLIIVNDMLKQEALSLHYDQIVRSVNIVQRAPQFQDTDEEH
jgi:hypothetical protein